MKNLTCASAAMTCALATLILPASLDIIAMALIFGAGYRLATTA